MNLKSKIAYRKNPGFSNPDMDKNMDRNKTLSSLSSSGRVVSPLAGRRSPTDELLEFEIVLFTCLGSFNQPIHISGVGCTEAVGSVISARFLIFCDVRKQGVFGVRIATGFRLPKGRLLNAVAH
jgi:hypothetical protein